jgi:alkaline phosphatase D
MRTYRGPNTANLQTERPDRVPWARAAGWLKAGLARSKAVWKVVAADMPLGLNVGHSQTAAGLLRWEAVANGEPGAPKGRELECAELLSYLKGRRVRNVVWLTAAVHYCAAHYYDPSRRVPGLRPVLEFVSGRLNAGSFGPNTGASDPQLSVSGTGTGAPRQLTPPTDPGTLG